MFMSESNAHVEKAQASVPSTFIFSIATISFGVSFSRFDGHSVEREARAGVVDHGAIARQRRGRGEIAGPPQAGHIEPLDERRIARRIEIADVEYRAASCFHRQRKQPCQRRIAPLTSTASGEARSASTMSATRWLAAVLL